MKQRSRFAITTLGIAVFTLSMSMHLASAQEENGVADAAIELDIEAQPIGDALNELAQQSGLQVVFFSEVAGDLEARAAVGNFESSEAALQYLLADTGLDYRFVNDRTVAIQLVGLTEEEGSEPGKSRPASSPVLIAQNQTSAVNHQQSRDDNQVFQIEEIIVTAQKRAESLQLVPITVTAFGEDAIHELRINGLDDVVGLTPSLAFADFGPASPNLSMRGIGSTDRDAGSDRSVVVFVDEVYMGRSGGSAFDLFDLERIEVLHGPQGTLFGKNVVGGAIHYISHKPEPETDAYLQVGVGNYNLRELRGMFNTALGQNVDGRFSFSSRDRDGYQTNLRTGNDVDTADNASVRGQILFSPTDNLDVLLSADATRDRIAGISRKVAPASGFTGFLGFFPDPDPRNVQTNVDGFFDRDMDGYSARLDWETSMGTLTSLTAYRDVEFEHSQDVVGIPLDSSFDANGEPRGFLSVDMTTEDYEILSQEIRLSSLSDSDRWTWVIGGFFSKEDTNRVSIRDRSLLGSTSKPRFAQENETTSTAIFGQATFAATDQLNFTFGGRYTRDEKDFGLTVTDESGGAADTLNPATETFSITAEEDWSEFTPKFVVDYSATPNALLYASVTRGYKSGGFQGFAPDAASAVIPFDPELAWSYEIGAKTQWLDNTLQVNLTGFFTDFEDLQFRQRVLTVPGDQASAVVIILNAADASIQGAEVGIHWLPVAGLTLNANYTYLDTELENFLADVSGVDPGFTDLSGNDLALSPSSAYTVSADYEFPIGDAGSVSVRAGYRYTGDHFFEISNPSQGEESGYGVVDGRVTYAPNNSGFEVAIWVKNATDEEYRSQVQVGAGTGISRFGAPRTTGISVSWQYE